ncbi:MAG: CoA transferase [Gammaproteobacteria bacterium]|nr:CoA transferase [Gammaproteobacteria bacterium]
MTNSTHTEHNLPAAVPGGPLAGLVVIDMATMMAGPHTAMMLADFGATVIKVESPAGDTSRASPNKVNGTSVYWRLLGRNKFAVTINLKHPKGRDLMLRLIEKADVLIENMRPGKLEALGLAPATLHERNRGLVILRVTGWGQTGPYANRPTFGTQAEAMSGFTYANGQPGGPPTLPPQTIADGAAGYLGAFSCMAALWRRAQDPLHRGQVIDLSLFEALFCMFGPSITAYDQLGIVPERRGSRAPVSAPRNIYQCRDGKWVAISCAADQIAKRFFALIGRPDLNEDARFSSGDARARHVEELDVIIAAWMSKHDAADVVTLLTDGGATAAPVYTIPDILADPQFISRDLIAQAPSEDVGPIRMQNAFPKFSESAGGVSWSGRPLGADNHLWFVEMLGLDPEQLAALHAEGAI